jgi:DNA mismatch repair protein MutS
MEAKTTTPMMEQYLELKQQHQNEVLFFRLGDFYEMFLDDAAEVSKLLNITLTKRNGVPMCGIPYHAAKNYIKRLLEEGKKIAICEQVEMPGPTGAIARREVVQVITRELLSRMSSSMPVPTTTSLPSPCTSDTWHVRV